jgi:hypothetical protein
VLPGIAKVFVPGMCRLVQAAPGLTEHQAGLPGDGADNGQFDLTDTAQVRKPIPQRRRERKTKLVIAA